MSKMIGKYNWDWLKESQSPHLEPMARGQPSPFSESAPQPTPPRSQAPSPDGDESDLEEDDEDLDFLIHFDSLKTNLAHEEACPDEGEEEEDEELEEWEGFGKEDLVEAMVGMFEVDDPSDLDWLPETLKNKRNKRKKEKKSMYSQSFLLISLLIMQPERPKTYQISSKSCGAKDESKSASFDGRCQAADHTATCAATFTDVSQHSAITDSQVVENEISIHALRSIDGW